MKSDSSFIVHRLCFSPCQILFLRQGFLALESLEGGFKRGRSLSCSPLCKLEGGFKRGRSLSCSPLCKLEGGFKRGRSLSCSPLCKIVWKGTRLVAIDQS